MIIIPEIVEFEIEKRKYKFNVPALLKIDKANIELELSEQASDYGFKYLLLGHLKDRLTRFQNHKKRQEEIMKEKFRRLESEIFLGAKENKKTDGVAKEMVKANEKREQRFTEYIKRREKLEEEESDLILLCSSMQAYVKGLEQRAACLTTLGGMKKREMGM